MGVRSLFRRRMVRTRDLRELLRNEKYAGRCAACKSTIRDDHLAKKDRRNNGELTAMPSCETPRSPSSTSETFERVQAADARTERAVHSAPRATGTPLYRNDRLPPVRKELQRRKTTHGKAQLAMRDFPGAWAKRIATPNRSPRTSSCQLQLRYLGMAEFDGECFPQAYRAHRSPRFQSPRLHLQGWAARRARLAGQIAPRQLDR